VAAMAQEGVFSREFVYRKIFGLNDKQIAQIKDGKRLDKLEDQLLMSIENNAAGGEVGDTPLPGEEPEPGAEELPDTLGGPPGGETPEPPPPMTNSLSRSGGRISESFDRNALQPGTIVRVDSDETLSTREFRITGRVMRGPRVFYRGNFVDEEETELTGNSTIDPATNKVTYSRVPPRSRLVPADAVYEQKFLEKFNPGSTGNRAEIAVDKGKNLFSTGEKAHSLAFGTKKQTASDPYDRRAARRMIGRPFSEDAGEAIDGLEEIEEAEEMLEDICRGLGIGRRGRA
jgi:hypothetical protein